MNPTLWVFILIGLTLALGYFLWKKDQSKILSNFSNPQKILNYQMRMIHRNNIPEKDKFILKNNGNILSYDGKCIESGNLPGDRILLKECNGNSNQKWKMENQNLISHYGLCMETIADEIRMWHCDLDFIHQRWSFT